MKHLSIVVATLCLALSSYGRIDIDSKEQERRERLKKTLPNRTNYVSPLRIKFEQAQAQAQSKLQMKGKYKPSDFEVISLNSPIKGKIARFALKLPNDFEVDQVKYKVQNASHLLDQKEYVEAKLVNGKELYIRLEDPTPGFYRLYLKVRNKNNNEEYQYQTAYLDYFRFMVAEKPFDVPMPDRAKNKATIAGVDTDRNGIRDDIQIWINEEFKDRPTVKLAMEQLARDRTLQLLTTSNIEESRRVTTKALDSGICLYSVVGIDRKEKLFQELEERLVNTKDRIHASIQASANFSGSGYELAGDKEEKKATCDFDF